MKKKREGTSEERPTMAQETPAKPPAPRGRFSTPNVSLADGVTLPNKKKGGAKGALELAMLAADVPSDKPPATPVNKAGGRKRRAVEPTGASRVVKSVLEFAESVKKQKRDRLSVSPIQEPTTPRLSSPEEDEDLRSIQKTLFTPKSDRKSKKRKPRADSNVVKKLSFVSDIKSESTPSKILLQDWCVVWPPVVEADMTMSIGKVQPQLDIRGMVDGKEQVYRVARRKTHSTFESVGSVAVELDDGMSTVKAEEGQVPSQVQELMQDGLPQRVLKKFKAIVNELDAGVRRDVKEVEPEAEPEPKTPLKEMTEMKRTKSGRVVSPVLDWWRGERNVTTVAGVKKHEGSPSQLDKSAPHTKKRIIRTLPKKPVKKEPKKEPKKEDISWSQEQLQALAIAQRNVRTTGNYWANVAKRVAGKTANECRLKSLEAFDDAATKKKKVGRKMKVEMDDKVPRAGTNKFKKQVRRFVQEYEKLHADDAFENSAQVAPDLAKELDELEAPGTMEVMPSPEKVGVDFLEPISASKRDAVDAYVRQLKRGKSQLISPEKMAAKSKKPKHNVQMEEESGGRVLKAEQSPGGTTRVRVQRSEWSDEDESSDSD